MDRQQILEQLKSERDRLDQAISALDGGKAPRAAGRRAGGRPKGSGGITAEGRRRLSMMMKKRWAARRKAAKKAA